VLFSLGLAAAAAMSASPFAAEAATPAVIDRTVICTPQRSYTGLREVDVTAAPRGAPPAPFSTTEQWPSRFVVSTGGAGRDANLVLVHSRTHPGMSPGFGPSGPGIYVNAKRCSRTRAPVRLSARGLSGPPIPWSKHAECMLRGRIIVRFRAVLESPGGWSRLDRHYDGVQRNVASASVAVRAVRKGRPVAFSRVDGDSMRLWLSPQCG
jgi:hypothetical protein